MPDRPLARLRDLWSAPPQADELERPCGIARTCLGPICASPTSPGGNTSSKIAELTDPLTGETVTVLAVKGSGGDLGSIRREGSRSCIWTSSSPEEALSRRSPRRRDGGVVSALYVSASRPRRPPSTRRFTPFCRSGTWIISIRTGPSPSQPRRTARRKLAEFNEASATGSSGCRGCGPASNSGFACSRPSKRTRLRRNPAGESRALHVGRHAGAMLPEQHPDDRRHGPVCRASTKHGFPPSAVPRSPHKPAIPWPPCGGCAISSACRSRTSTTRPMSSSS